MFRPVSAGNMPRWEAGNEPPEERTSPEGEDNPERLTPATSGHDETPPPEEHTTPHSHHIFKNILGFRPSLYPIFPMKHQSNPNKI